MTLLEVRKDLDHHFEERLLMRHHRLMDDFSWIHSNKANLRTTYPNKYIAVQNKTVRFYGETLKEVISSIQSSGARTQEFAIEYISLKTANLFL